MNLHHIVPLVWGFPKVSQGHRHGIPVKSRSTCPSAMSLAATARASRSMAPGTGRGREPRWELRKLPGGVQPAKNGGKVTIGGFLLFLISTVRVQAKSSSHRIVKVQCSSSCFARAAAAFISIGGGRGRVAVFLIGREKAE